MSWNRATWRRPRAARPSRRGAGHGRTGGRENEPYGNQTLGSPCKKRIARSRPMAERALRGGGARARRGARQRFVDRPRLLVAEDTRRFVLDLDESLPH